MLKYIEETGNYLEITGFRNIVIGDAKEFLKKICRENQQHVLVQFFDAGLVATWQHLHFAVLNALLAFKNERNISKSVTMEAILYASAQHQIIRAIDLMGVKSDSANVAVLLIGKSPDSVKTVLSRVSEAIGAESDEAVLELSRKKVKRIREAFNFTEKELNVVMEKGNFEQALVKLVIERIALLSTRV
jgi:tRNA threonylcarbamoyladenosine modification (KEOPS) complex Cgi121 subunit